MSGVTEAAPLAKSLSGIVQAFARLPKHIIRRVDPLMSSFYEHREVRHDPSLPKIHSICAR